MPVSTRKATKPLSLAVLARRIADHLTRFENDPTINRHPDSAGMGDLRPYYMARVWAGGSYVMVSYVSYQGVTSLRREEAEVYLAWLDAGNVGRHSRVPSLTIQNRTKRKKT